MGILRFILALTVALFHFGGVFGLKPMGGWIAVEGFFIISGFYMSLVLSRRYPATREGTKAFYLNRYLRLYPAYLTAVVLMVIALILIGGPAASTDSIADLTQRVPEMSFGARLYLAIANFTMFGTDLTGFLAVSGKDLVLTIDGPGAAHPAYRLMFLPQGWTLGLELAFYLCAPFLLRMKPRAIIGFAAASFVLRIVLARVFHLPDAPWIHAFFPSILFLFLLGALAQRFSFGAVLLRKKSWVVGAWAGMVAFILFFKVLPGSDSLKYWLFLALMTVTIHPIFELSRNIKWDSLLGQLSYPLYLSHLLTQYVLVSTFGPVDASLKIVASIMLAAALYLLVDRNLDVLRTRVRQGSRAWPLPEKIWAVFR